MSSAYSLFGKPAWDKTLVSPIDPPAPSSSNATTTQLTLGARRDRVSEGPPGKLLSPHRAPRKSGLFPSADEFAGLDRLDRSELDEAVDEALGEKLDERAAS